MKKSENHEDEIYEVRRNLMHELITQSCTEKTGGDVGDEEAPRPTYVHMRGRFLTTCDTARFPLPERAVALR